MKQKAYILILFSLLLLTSCENKEQKAAQQLFEEAQEMVLNEQFEDALILLDSLQNSYPELVDIRRKAFELSKALRIEQGRKDSLVIVPELKIMELKADSLYKSFSLIEAPDMPDENILRYKGYDPSVNSSSPFLDCYLTPDGELKLVAGISAIYPIKSIYVKVYDSKQERFEVSDTIPYDGGLNYRYEYLSRYYERLTFSSPAASRVASFISEAPDYEQIRLIFYREDGSSMPAFTLNNRAKEAIKGTYEYYLLLQKMLQMDQQLRQHEQRLFQREQDKARENLGK